MVKFYVLLILGLSIHAFAFLVVPADVLDHAKKANEIIHAKVLSTKLVHENVKRPYFETEFEIIELIKGQKKKTMKVKQVVLKRKGSKIFSLPFGMNPFVVKKEYVIFWPKIRADGFSLPQGLHEGVYELVESQAQGKVMIQSWKNHVYTQPENKNHLRKESSKLLTLDDFKKMLQKQ